MSRRILTPEERREIIDLYLNTDLTTMEIGQKFNISNRTVSYTVCAAGETLRRPKKPQETKNKPCPKCRRKVVVKGARFCPYCGSDIRSENEILAEQLCKLTELCFCIPETSRDKFITTINQAANALKKM